MKNIIQAINANLQTLTNGQVELLRVLAVLLIISFGNIWCVSSCCNENGTPPIDNTTFISNNYFDPFTITFTNPLTHQLAHIITVYHYAMSFLVFIMLITFSYIVFSLSNTRIFTNSLDLAQWNNESVLSFYEIAFSYEFYNNNYAHFVNSRKFTHASVLEFFWAVLPAIILALIAYPSFLLLYNNENFADPIYNISVIGNQWFWTYEYNDINVPLIVNYFILDGNIDIEIGLKNYIETNMNSWCQFNPNNIMTELPTRVMFDSNLTIYTDPNYPRLLCTDEVLVLPSSTPLSLIVTSSDVIHSWAVPSYGVNVDAIPGSLNQAIVNLPVMGTTWGQCSELCGVNHGFMPIEVNTMHSDDFLYYLTFNVIDCGNDYVNEYFQSNVYGPLNAIINLTSIYLTTMSEYYSELEPEDLTPFGWLNAIWVLQNNTSLINSLMEYNNPLVSNCGVVTVSFIERGDPSATATLHVNAWNSPTEEELLIPRS